MSKIEGQRGGRPDRQFIQDELYHLSIMYTPEELEQMFGEILPKPIIKWRSTMPLIMGTKGEDNNSAKDQVAKK